MVEVIPSVLSADFARLADEIGSVERGAQPVLGVADNVLLMSVNPGFGGQDLILKEVVCADCDWIVTASAVFHSADAAATVRQMPGIAANALAVRV